MKNNKFLKYLTILSVFSVLGASLATSNIFKTNGEGEQNTVKEGYTRYEAEDAELFDCVAKGKVEDSPADYGHYSGLGFVGSIDNDDATLIFTVTVGEAGAYPIYVGYAIDGGFANAGMQVYVNGEYFQTWAFKQKNGWGEFESTTPLLQTINLGSGVNKIKLQHGYNYVEIDYIDIGPRLGDDIDPIQTESEIGKVPEGYTRYEAEDGIVTGGNFTRSLGTCSGRGFIGELDFLGTSQIEWKVNVPEKGEYSLHIAYAIGTGFGDASDKIFVNEELYNIVVFTEKNGWGVFEVSAICETTISLLEGDNKVVLAKSGEFAQIDFIDVSNAKVGEWKATGYELKYPNLLEGYTRYEAEEQYVILGEPKGIGFYLDIGSYSGTGYVGSLDKDQYYVEFPIKNVPEDGKYQIRVGYACFEAGASLKFYSGQYGRGGQCYFDNEQFSTTGHGWGMFEDDLIFETTINLKAGNRSYIMVRSGFTRCEIDYIDLGAKVGEYEQGTLDETMDRHNY